MSAGCYLNVFEVVGEEERVGEETLGIEGDEDLLMGEGVLGGIGEVREGEEGEWESDEEGDNEGEGVRRAGIGEYVADDLRADDAREEEGDCILCSYR